MTITTLRHHILVYLRSISCGLEEEVQRTTWVYLSSNAPAPLHYPDVNIHELQDIFVDHEIKERELRNEMRRRHITFCSHFQLATLLQQKVLRPMKKKVTLSSQTITHIIFFSSFERTGRAGAPSKGLWITHIIHCSTSRVMNLSPWQ
jgi:hypothetical protein